MVRKYFASLLSIDRSICIINYCVRTQASQATQICIFRTSKSLNILRQDLEKRFSSVSVKLVHFYFTAFSNEMSILRTLIICVSVD